MLRFCFLLIGTSALLAAQQERVGPFPLGTRIAVSAAKVESKNTGSSCGIAGKVQNALTGESLIGAHVLLRRVNVGFGDAPASYSAATDENGSFILKEIEPGNYRLSAKQMGFVPSEFGARELTGIGTTLSLEPGQQLNKIVFELMPQAVLAGRVADERGRPVALAEVDALGYRYNRGYKQLATFGNAVTNDLGEYRIFGLAPGRYYVRATYTLNAPFESVPAGSRGEEYVPFYYPRATDLTSATTVTAGPGAQVTGTDLTLSRIPTLHIRGHVNSPIRGLVTVVLSGGANRMCVSGLQGRFELRGVTPGAYTLVASVLDSSRHLTVRRQVEISSNIDDLSITIPEPVALSGRIQTDGDETPSLLNVRISLRPRQPGASFGRLPAAEVSTDGSFTLSNVSPDDYDIIATGLPDGYYIKAIKAGGQNVLDAGLAVDSTSVAPITLLLSPGAGTVEGAVRNDRGHATAGATVVLIPQEEQRRRASNITA